MISPGWQWTITAGLAVVTSIGTGFFPPLVKWGIEKKRQLREERRQRLVAWRAFLDDAFLMGPRNTTTWAHLSQYLTRETFEKVESYKEWEIIPSEGMFALRRSVSDELNKLEHKWRLL